MNTVGRVLDALSEQWRTPGFWCWPPDVFALAATLLRLSGGYTRVLDEAHQCSAEARGMLEHRARVWTRLALAACLGEHSAPQAAPAEYPVSGEFEGIEKLRTSFIELQELHLDEFEQRADAVRILLDTLSLADECCRGFGIPIRVARQRELIARGESDRVRLVLATSKLMMDGQNPSLALSVSADLARVLPKLHTPQTGLTLRSLSHHLGLHTGSDIRPRWHYAARLGSEAPARRNFNVLVLPWPLDLQTSRVEAVRRDPERPFGTFRLNGLERSDLAAWAIDMVRKATVRHGQVDFVVLPELATNPIEFELVWDSLRKPPCAIRMLIAGVDAGSDTEGTPDNPAGNTLWLRTLIGDSGKWTTIKQQKHHRWCLDRSQLLAYGLTARLSADRIWWEDFEIGQRVLNFVTVHGTLTMACLVCEDLARQEPASELIRTVGPNLVIALLLDGPQQASRWSARYGTVLADDPGSSVLTLTALGMVDRWQPPPGIVRQRTIGLWQDACSRPRELVLDEGAQALLLSVVCDQRKEWTADGRDDGAAAGVCVLAGVYQV